MCGIYGIIQLANQEDKTLALSIMMRASEYRGPDSQSSKSVNGVNLGFNRLAIIDLDERSNQPFERKDLEKIIVFNGEIYNYLEIKGELVKNGYQFFTESDTEVLLVAFHHYGEKVFQMLNGMWAFCVYDFKNNEITLSRDRFGVKPLYYMYEQGALYFASEIKSLLSVKAEIEPSKSEIDSYLIFGVNKFITGRTFIEGVFEHPAGTFSKLNDGRLIFTKHYHAPEIQSQLDLEEVSTKLREAFRSSLKLRMRSDVPVAILLSGGLDSSLIAYHLNDMVERKEIEVQKIHAFTLNFGDFDKNEWQIVEKNKHLLPHIVCEPITISIEGFQNEINKLLAQNDLPTLSISHLLHIVAQREIRKRGFKVLINGQGPDEVYGGYFPQDIGYLLFDYFKKDSKSLFREMRMIKSNWKLNYSNQIKLVFQALLHKSFQSVYVNLKRKRAARMLNVNFGVNDLYSDGFNSNDFYEFRSKSQVFSKEFNGILNYEDSTSMLNSLEMRSPFMDYRIIDLGLALPIQYKLKGGHSKWILRHALGDILPDDIRWASWKLGYVVPKAQLMKDIMPKAVVGNESNYSYFWRSFNLKKWLENYKIS